jgi:hypothetical protein
MLINFVRQSEDCMGYYLKATLLLLRANVQYLTGRSGVFHIYDEMHVPGEVLVLPLLIIY